MQEKKREIYKVFDPWSSNPLDLCHLPQVKAMRLAAKDLKQETTETLLDDIIPTFSQEKIKRNREVEKRKVHHYTALLRLTSTTIQRFSDLWSTLPAFSLQEIEA